MWTSARTHKEVLFLLTKLFILITLQKEDFTLAGAMFMKICGTFMHNKDNNVSFYGQRFWIK